MSSSSLALAELIAFMEESHVENRSTVFRLADLSKLYEARVNQLGGQFPVQQARAHNTHLKKRLLQNVPGLVAFNQGREVYLSYDEEVACTLERQYKEEKDTESITMARLANSIRNDMFATRDNSCGKLQIEKQVKEIRALPSSFTEVKPLISPTNMTAPVGLSEDTQRNTMLLPSVVREEKEWLDHVSDHLTQEINKESALSWAAFHASKCHTSMLPSINSMLPLFQDEASSFAMLRHCLVVVQAAIHRVNPGQTPVICVDQPLFAKLKQIQWADEIYSEDNFVILFGGFHIEMTALKGFEN
ncbi:hypothetical protein ElyMa_005286600 [Elysia marginata]|uniref:HTH OST-type domain-containing protein n=1 Tax=Elysia marginata TaxID=1093978 RepID=A0AAV4K209_9GAST|nr:hypothetical protein ElyMa_005286600 [Elysia marginata]